MDKNPLLLYQGNAVNLLVKAGVSYEEAKDARRAFAMKNMVEINFYLNVFEQTTRKRWDSKNKTNAYFPQ